MNFHWVCMRNYRRDGYQRMSYHRGGYRRMNYHWVCNLRMRRYLLKDGNFLNLQNLLQNLHLSNRESHHLLSLSYNQSSCIGFLEEWCRLRRSSI